MTGSTASGPGIPGPGWRDTIEGECPWCRTGDRRPVGLPELRPANRFADRSTGTAAADATTAVVASTVTEPSVIAAPSTPPWAPPPVAWSPMSPAVVARRRIRGRPVQSPTTPREAELGPSRPLNLLGWVGVAAVFVAIFAIVLTTRDSDGGRASETLPSVSSGPPVTTIAQVPPVVTPRPRSRPSRRW